jgi:polysaccharide export outer membrane protein
MQHQTRFAALVFLAVVAIGNTGCRLVQPQPHSVSQDVPRELNKAILPTYTIEPPDVLTIDAINIVPKAPYRLKMLDVLAIQVHGTLPEAPIDGVYRVELGGMIHLGFSYGSLKVVGSTVDEAKAALEKHLAQHLKDPLILLSIAELAAKQPIAGEHLVALDGTVTLGSYGSVQIIGKTVAQAKQAIEKHLAQYLADPEVSVDVFGYNSKVYYIVTQGAGLGDGLYRFPVTGNETVLDAISQINGLQQVSSKKIWIARPGRDGNGCYQVLPVNWDDITSCAAIDTNYQILPGDRVFIAEDELVAFDIGLGKLTAPLERIMGFVLLGTGTVTRLSGPVLRGGGDQRGYGP